MERRKRSAAYGAACTNCSRAKSRCITTSAGNGCERCRRLRKECVSSGTVRRAKDSSNKLNRNRLEAKIDGLVSLITSGSGSSANIVATHDGIPTVPSTGASFSPSTSTYTAQNHQDTTSSTTLTRLSTTATAAARVLQEIPTGQDDEILSEFQNSKLVHFPFIYIGPETTAAELRLSRPFLWLCIVAISTRSASSRTELYAQIRSILATSMVTELEKSLEQLLGLLVCISWGNAQVHKRPFVTLFSQLAMSVVYELGLNKSPPEKPTLMTKYSSHHIWVSSRRTMEERRAVLAFYCITSLFSCYVHLMDNFHWTSHMSECLQELAQSSECQGDLVLATMVSLQKIAEKAGAFPWWQQDVREKATTTRVSPPSFYARVLQTELDDVKRQIPPQLQNNEVIVTWLNFTSVTIHEYALCAELPTDGTSDFSKVDGLYSCLTGCKCYFDALFMFPPRQYIGFPMSTLFHLTHCVFTLYKLSVLDDTAWDKNEVNNTANVTVIVHRIVQNLRDAAALAGFQHDADGPEDQYSKRAAIIDAVLRTWDPNNSVQLLQQERSVNEEQAENVDLGYLIPDMPEEFWITDLLFPWGDW